MRVTVIGHSCLRIETRAGTILVDPWLSGSCYWRSWWHFPPSEEPDDEMLRPDWVYLTHHHFDHFHFPSMRRLDRRAKVLIPKFGVDVMAGEVTGLDFAPPHEMPHGKVIDLGDGVRIASYQYGFDDSVFVVAEDDHVVVDINDAKIRGSAVRRIAAVFGPPSVAFKSHSFAQSYPVLYDSQDPSQLRLISSQTYIADFHDVMSDLKPVHAVPFGSMVGFLHRESWPVNDHLVTPQAVIDGVAALGSIANTDVVTMAPGDSWSSDVGFDRSDFDWYVDRATHLDDLAAKHAPKLAEQARTEAGRTLDWPTFESHLGAFVRDVPRLFARRVIGRRFVFHVPSDVDTPYWWVSFADRAVGRSAGPPSDRSGITTVSEAVLADAMRDRILHVVHGSMRIHTDLAVDGVHSDLAFWGVLMMWELGYFPLRRIIWRPRVWFAAARRWRELLDQVPVLFDREPVDRFASRTGALNPISMSPCPPPEGYRNS